MALPTILACAALATPFSIGHVDRHGNVPHSTKVIVKGSHVAMSLPPRTEFGDLSDHRFLTITRVSVVNGRVQRATWHDDYISYGRVATFNGDAITNFSYTRWINVRGYIS